MFKKEEGALGEKPTSSNTKTIIGPSVKIEGDFTSEDNIEVEGQVNGTLKTSQDLSVGKEAKIKAEVEAANIFVAGEIKGNIFVKDKVELASTAKISGDITTNIISIESGAVVNGKCLSGQTDNMAKPEKKNGKRKEEVSPLT